MQGFTLDLHSYVCKLESVLESFLNIPHNIIGWSGTYNVNRSRVLLQRQLPNMYVMNIANT
jgi:hypothetical protein